MKRGRLDGSVRSREQTRTRSAVGGEKRVRGHAQLHRRRRAAQRVTVPDTGAAPKTKRLSRDFFMIFAWFVTLLLRSLATGFRVFVTE